MLGPIRSIPATLACASVLGCESPRTDGLPPLAWEGERVVFGTDFVDEVCTGTLEALDATVESIELELQLEPREEKIAFYLVDNETIDAECGPSLTACLQKGRVLSSKAGFNYKRHELVHALTPTPGKPLFVEGLAAALDQDGGCLASNTCVEAGLDALLLASGAVDLSTLDGYTAGADLVHGMLGAYGPEQVLAFIGELPKEATPDEARSLYLEYFGSGLDEDFLAFQRGPFDEHTLAQRGCDGLLPVPNAGDDGSIEIHGVMNCGDSGVVDLFGDPARGVIEWMFEITPEQSGAFLVSFSPDDDVVFLRGCRPPSFGHHELAALGPYRYAWSPSAGDEVIILAAGQYSVRWPSDFGAEMDFTLIPPCVFEVGGCPPGQQCNIWNECLAQVDSPAALGAPCEQADEAPLACEAGSRCLGGSCVAECDATQPCPGGQGCSCLLSRDAELGSGRMGVCVAAGEGSMVAIGERANARLA